MKQSPIAGDLEEHPVPLASPTSKLFPLRYVSMVVPLAALGSMAGYSKQCLALNCGGCACGPFNDLCRIITSESDVNTDTVIVRESVP